MIEIGTTPTHIFEDIPTDICSMAKEVKITYKQSDNEVLVKRTGDCTIGDGKITTRLSQEDTFCFDHEDLVSIQIRILTQSGECFKSDEMVVTAGKCLDDEVLV